MLLLVKGLRSWPLCNFVADGYAIHISDTSVLVMHYLQCAPPRGGNVCTCPATPQQITMPTKRLMQAMFTCRGVVEEGLPHLLGGEPEGLLLSDKLQMLGPPAFLRLLAAVLLACRSCLAHAHLVRTALETLLRPGPTSIVASPRHHPSPSSSPR